MLTSGSSFFRSTWNSPGRDNQMSSESWISFEISGGELRAGTEGSFESMMNRKYFYPICWIIFEKDNLLQPIANYNCL